MYLINIAGVRLFDDKGGPAGLILNLAIAGGAGILAYTGMLYILKAQELVYIVNLLKSKFDANKK
jgi:hypothetical protein